MVTLVQHIDACMSEANLRIGATGPCHRALHEALATDPVMAMQAHAVIQAGSAVEKRDHVTRWRNTMLRLALKGQNVSGDE